MNKNGHTDVLLYVCNGLLLLLQIYCLAHFKSYITLPGLKHASMLKIMLMPTNTLTHTRTHNAKTHECRNFHTSASHTRTYGTISTLIVLLIQFMHYL